MQPLIWKGKQRLVGTPSFNSMQAILICISVGLGGGIAISQCKHTIKYALHCLVLCLIASCPNVKKIVSIRYNSVSINIYCPTTFSTNFKIYTTYAEGNRWLHEQYNFTNRSVCGISLKFKK